MTENDTKDSVAEEGTTIEINRHDDAADEKTEKELEASNEADTEAAENEEVVEDDPLLALEKELKTAKEEATQSYDRFLRVSAEFDNFKKRNSRETAEFKKYANETLFKNLLTVVDNLERALEVAETSNDGKGLIDGVKLTVAEILKIFANFGVTPIEAVGEPFDPALHQAMQQEESDEYPENTVTQMYQKGYRFHDRLLRPAMVVVAKKN
jgi:molecular chaperone GrpE